MHLLKKAPLWRAFLLFIPVFLLTSCVLEADQPILEEEAEPFVLNFWADTAPDISGAYYPPDEDKEDPMVLRRKDGSHNTFILGKEMTDGESLVIIVAPLSKPGTLLLQATSPPDKGAILFPARVTEEGLVVYTDPKRWDQDAWEQAAEKHGFPLGSDPGKLPVGADKKSLLAAMDDMFTANALGEGERLVKGKAVRK